MIERLAYLRNRHLFMLDVILLPIAVYFAFVLRLERFDLGRYWPVFFIFVGCVLIFFPLVFRFTGLYSRYWRYASVEELLLLVGAVTVAVMLAASSSFLISYFLIPKGVLPRSIPFIFLGMALAVTASPRFIVRLSSGRRITISDEKRQRVLIAGAGDAGQMLAREIRKNPSRGKEVVGFVDDDPQKQGLTVRAMPIYGGCADIPDLAERMGVDEVIIAMPSTSGERVREIVEVCREADVSVQIMPELVTLLSTDFNLRHLRPVRIEDLLRRDPIETDLAAVHELVQGKTVLVTGAGGSIGSELCRQIAQVRPKRLLLLGHGEYSIFEIYNELKREFQAGHTSVESVEPVIADVRDYNRLRQIFETYHPQVVFHAAAHKHVPLMEANPGDAITNNILGTHHLLEVCLDHDIERFVLISTDKAVNPANIMGVTKRMAELLVLDAAGRSGSSYVAVRFGNVLGSRGSVVPFFEQQIARGGPVTVTHKDVTRYFMTIPEAVQLVLQAATLGAGGDLFMLDMGKPIRIVDLATDLVRLSGLQPGEDIEIQFTGLRPGEKLNEELYQGHESHASTEHEKIVRVTSNFEQPGNLGQAMQRLYMLSTNGDIDEALALIAALVPEYTPPDGIEPRPLSAAPTTPLADSDAIPLHARWY